MNKNIKTAIIIIIAFMIGGVFTYVLLKWVPNIGTTNSSGIKTVTKSGQVIIEKNSIASAVSKVKDGVVLIEAYDGDTAASIGTGFFYKTDDKYGYIMTNQHVVGDYSKIVVVLSTDEEVEGKVLGKDEYLDLAVIRVDKSKALNVLSVGDVSKMSLGDTVFTVGSSLGYDYRGSVTSGVLSGKDRMVAVSVNNANSSDWVMKVLQIDAAVNPGNSGGPLVNVNGEVVGIISMKLVREEVEGMGFAIPIDFAMNHVDALEKGEKIDWPVLGINMANVDDETSIYRNKLNIDSSIKEGVIVVEVVAKTGAASSDLQKGDVITAINGEKVKNSAYLRYELYKYKVGDTIEVTYNRSGKEAKTKVKLSKS